VRLAPVDLVAIPELDGEAVGGVVAEDTLEQTARFGDFEW